MNRRDVLALLASAPIAALAPLPKILEWRYAGHPGISIRYIKKWDIVMGMGPVTGKCPDWSTYLSQPKTDAERLALKMVTEARARYAGRPVE